MNKRYNELFKSVRHIFDVISNRPTIISHSLQIIQISFLKSKSWRIVDDVRITWQNNVYDDRQKNYQPIRRRVTSILKLLNAKMLRHLHVIWTTLIPESLNLQCQWVCFILTKHFCVLSSNIRGYTDRNL